jgi:uncharacterized protein DUF6122
MELLRLIIHYGLHLIFPIFIAYFFFNKNWKGTYLILLTTMLIDLDHLLATPIFDPNRCSINFHPLHTFYALAVYIILLGFKKTRLIGIGLCLHFLTDALDCLWL